jgi:hypothetical protein
MKRVKMNTMTSSVKSKEGLTHYLGRMVDDAEQFLKAATHNGDQKIDAVREAFAGKVRHMRAQGTHFVRQNGRPSQWSIGPRQCRCVPPASLRASASTGCTVRLVTRAFMLCTR